jgi:sphingomyelin phosphodiesterase
MNYCNNQNWWLLLNTTDPADELTWFIRELQTAELSGEKVMVIGHIPPGSNDCLQVWSRNYYRIINRFEDTITGQFFGHTHQDEFQLFYDEHDEQSGNHFLTLRPTSVAYVAPSVTTFDGVNPGYRVYTINADTNDVHDYETFFVNLTRANEGRDRSSFVVESSYTAREDLKLINLHPSQWHHLVIDMIRDTSLFEKFEKYFSNQSDSYKSCREEDWICRADLLCRLVTGRAHDYSFCQRLVQDFKVIDHIPS